MHSVNFHILRSGGGGVLVDNTGPDSQFGQGQNHLNLGHDHLIGMYYYLSIN